MYNDIPKSYKISTKKIDKSLTYNKYSKAEVLKDLEKNLFSKSIEKTIFWGCELIISEYIDILYERLFQFFIMDINISNIQSFKRTSQDNEEERLIPIFISQNRVF